MRPPISRRNFTQTLAAGAAISSIAFPNLSAQSKSGKKYRTALIGSGWWGMNVLRVALEDGRVDVVALCDVDEEALEISADDVDALTGKLPNTYTDYRELLEKEDIEIAIICTPDHWHALQTIACVNAGAHVFVEKPTGHTIVESRAMVTAARANERKVQVGLHRRIGPHHLSGMDFLKSGKVGDIGMVRMFVTGNGGKEEPRENEEIPDYIDWEMYCGPSALRPFNRKIHRGGFRNFQDYANGTLGDWGVHWLDQVLMWSDETSPKSVHCSGGRPIKGAPINDERGQTTDTPDHQVATYEFENFTAVWEHHAFGGNNTEKSKYGCYFYGTNGIFHMGWRDGWTFYPAKGDDLVHEDPSFDNEKDGHNVPPLWADFIDSIAEKDRLPVADIEIGHRSTNLSLLGMLSWKLGRSIDWDGETETIPNDPEASALLRREYRGDWEYPA